MSNGSSIGDGKDEGRDASVSTMTTNGEINTSNSNNRSSLRWWESPVFWLTSEVLNSPTKVFCIGTVAVLAGTYVGFKIPASTIENISTRGYAAGMSSSSSSSSGPATAGSGLSSSTTHSSSQSTQIPYAELDPETRAQRQALAVGTARRAFRFATIGTVGVFGLAGSIWFYVIQGYRSLDDATSAWTRLGKRIQTNLESFMGGDTAPSRRHPDMIATRNMTEDQEMKFLYDKYIREAAEEGGESLNDDNSN